MCVHTHKKEEVEQEQEVLGGRDAPLPHGNASGNESQKLMNIAEIQRNLCKKKRKDLPL